MMNRTHLVHAMLATSLALASLAGCASPNASRVVGLPKDGASLGSAKPAGAVTSGQKQGAAATIAVVPAVMTTAAVAQTTAASLDDERDMEAYGLMADGAASFYGVLDADVSLTADATASNKGGQAAGAGEKARGQISVGRTAVVIKAGAEKQAAQAAQKAAQQAQRQQRQQAQIEKALLQKAIKAQVAEQVRLKLEQRRKGEELRLAAKVLKVRKNEHDAIAKVAKGAGWVDNGDGTESKQVETDVTKTVNGKSLKRHVQIERVRNKETKLLIAAHDTFEETLPNGTTRSARRDKVLQDGGSYLVTFHNEMLFEKGVKRVADWNKTISAEGVVSGTGHIVWTDADGKVLKDVQITLKGTDGDQQADVEGGAKVTLPLDGDAKVDDQPVDTVDPAGDQTAKTEEAPAEAPAAEASTAPQPEETAGADEAKPADGAAQTAAADGQ